MKGNNMSQLSNFINEAVAVVMVKGRVSTQKVADLVEPKLDDLMRHSLMFESLKIRIKKQVCKTHKQTREDDDEEPRLTGFDLHSGYALDVADKYIKRTQELTELEFLRIITIREEQLVDDSRHLSVLRKAYDTVKPFWQVEMNFGEAEAAYRAAALAAE